MVSLTRRAPRLSAWLSLSASLAASPPAFAQQAAAPSLADEAKRPKLTKPPKLSKFVEAPYPESEKAAGQQASVVLQIAISATGSVDQAQVVKGAGAAFDQAAIAAVKQFVFEPAEIDNRPAPIRIQYRYDFVLKEEAPTTGVLSGVVKKRGGGEPMSGVTVSLEDGTSTQTDAEGRFELPELAPGAHTVTLSGEALKGLQTQETIVAGEQLKATYEVDLAPAQAPGAAPAADEDDLEIVIVLPTLTKQVVSVKVEADQARRVAGTQGDVLKIVENMPGVARASAGSGQVVVWGASPEDTRVYVDDVRVPLLYHFGGLRSIVHTDLVQSVELIPGGYGSSYGRGLGGLITVALREPDTKRLHGAVQVDLLDASVSASGKIAEGWTFAGAARKSYLDRTLDVATDRDVGEYFPIPHYHDAQLRVQRRLGEKKYVELGGLLSSDQVSRTVSSGDPSERKAETKRLRFERVYARYVSTEADGSEIRVTPWVGRDRSSLVASFGSTPTELTAKSTSFGLRLGYATRIAESLTSTVGLDLEAGRSDVHRAGSVSTPPREGDARTFGQPPSGEINSSNWRAIQGSAAPHVEADLGLLRGQLHVVPGLRVEPFFMSVDRRAPEDPNNPPIGAYTSDISLQPRVSVRYAPSERASFKLAWGRYAQAPQVEDQSPVFGNPLLGIANASHYLASTQVNVTSKLSAETTAFYSRSSDLTVRNPSLSPLLGQALVGAGEGRAYGAQFLIRRQIDRGFFGWVAFTVMRAERRDGPDAAWRLFDFDQTHVLTALASYDLGHGFDVGVRFRYATGFPRTPVVGAFFDARRNLYEPVLGERNSIRIPAFAQLDVRVAKTFKIAATKAEIYADVQNVTDRDNPEELVYSQNYAERRTIRGLPILPVVGARWEF
ncbi:MAG TPA: TonB family protein [Polyangiaceae bacterium]|nr:TonB family protein [Polyangiaceae bacterium]